jgi:hypothetical protein
LRQLLLDLYEHGRRTAGAVIAAKIWLVGTGPTRVDLVNI